MALSTLDRKITYAELESIVLGKLNAKSPGKFVYTQPINKIEFVACVLAALESGKAFLCTDKDEEIDLETAGTHSGTAIVLKTSGSRSKSKYVCLSSENIMANLNAVCQSIDFKSSLCQILHLPLNYSFGLLGQCLTGLMAGHEIIFSDSLFQTSKLIRTKEKIMLSGVPSHAEFFVKMAQIQPEITSRVNQIVVAGGALSLSTRKNLLSLYNARVYSCYGLTEASPRILSISSDEPEFLLGMTGKPVGQWQCKIGSDNELMCRGPQVMLGYLNAASPNIADGWLRTGDLAERASGKYYNIVGRIDDQVKVSGINISLDEVKNHINKLSQVKFCEFVRDQMDVFMLVGADTNTKESIQQMLMAKYPWEVNKHIKLVFCKNIPYNDRGKIDLLQARALHEQGENSSGSV